MTEEEAKTKDCCGPPALAWASVVLYMAERDALEIEASRPRCTASACMAWRWTNDIERRWDLPANQPPEGEGWKHVEAIGGVAHWVRKHSTPHGYCGLAGTP